MDDGKNKIKLNLEISEEAAGAQPVQEVVQDTEVIQDAEALETAAFYRQVRQGDITNAYNKAKPKKTDHGDFRAATAKAVFDWPDNPPAEQQVGTLKLHNFLVELVEDPNDPTPAGRTAETTLVDFMEACGISKNRAGAMRPQVESYMVRLLRTTVTAKTVRNGQLEELVGVPLFQRLEYKRGKIKAIFNVDYSKDALARSKMYFPKAFYKIDPHKDRNAFSLGMGICSIKKMHVGTKSEDVYTVKNLLTYCRFIPTYKEVMAGSKAVTREIIEPFYTALNTLTSIGFIEYEFVDENGQPIPDEVKSANKYGDFITWYVRITFVHDPYTRKRLERQQADAEIQAIQEEAAHKILVDDEAKKQRTARTKARKSKKS